MFKSSRFNFVFVTCLTLVLSFEALAQTAAVVVKENTLIRYKQSPNSKVEVVLNCTKEVEKVCQEFQVVKKSIYKIGDNSRTEQLVLTEALARQEMQKRLNLTLGQDVFPEQNPARDMAGLVILPIPLIAICFIFPGFWPLIPVAGVVAVGALAVLPLAVVATVFLSGTSAIKRARWKKITIEAMAGKLIKRPLRVHNAGTYQALVDLLTVTPEVEDQAE